MRDQKDDRILLLWRFVVVFAEVLVVQAEVEVAVDVDVRALRVLEWAEDVTPVAWVRA